MILEHRRNLTVLLFRPQVFPSSPVIRYSFFSFASFVRQPVAVIVCPVIFAPALSLDSARGVRPNASARPNAPVRFGVEHLCTITPSRPPRMPLHVPFHCTTTD